MFEEALQKAPREELVQHIRLQRELIQRLHRRVIELEASLEAAHEKNGRGSARASDEDDGEGTRLEQRQLTSSREDAELSSQDGMKAGQPNSSLPPKNSTANVSAPSSTQQVMTTFHREPYKDSAVAPEPRRTMPLPHGDTRAPTRSQRSYSAALVPQVAERAVSAPLPPTPSTATPAVPDALLSDHPTVLEGIKEINYVLAAHRAGRPSLPLAVVEELEDIRSRLLQNFRLMCIVGVDEQHSPSSSLAAPAAGHEDESFSGSITLGRIEGIRQSYRGMGEAFREGGRVRPRWVSPDASRVIYGDALHRQGE